MATARNSKAAEAAEAANGQTKVTTNGTLIHNGDSYPPNTVVTLPTNDATLLVRAGVVALPETRAK
jgi:hypothetical protein